MYLVDFQLKELCEKHGLVSPFDPARINPARSYQQTGRYVGEAAQGAVLAKE